MARQFLAKNGEFYPYAVSMANDGTTRMVAAYEGSEHPASTDLLAMLYDGLRGQGGDLRAAVVVSDVRIKNPDSDAVRVEVEHREGVALAVLLPYRVQTKSVDREVAYGELRAIAAKRRIWPESSASA